MRPPQPSFLDILTVEGGDGMELSSSLSLLAIGIWLLLPFKTISGNAAYAVLYALLPSDLAWSAGGLGLGAFGMWALIRRRKTARRLAAFSSCCLWLFLATMTALGNITSLATPIYAVLAFGAGLSYLRLSLLRSAR